MQELKANIQRVTTLVLWGFLLVCVLFGYWQVIRAPALRADARNQQAQRREKTIKPGHIYTADGEVILGVSKAADGWQRSYPGGKAYCHITGYSHNSGLQSAMHEALLGIGPYEDWWRRLRYGQQCLDVQLTINSNVQELATRLMQGKRGAAIALSPRSGAIRAMVSSPSYDPARLQNSKFNYEMFRNNPAAPELNRALQGLYPPGPAFKIFTAATALDTGVAEPGTIFECGGAERVAGILVTCRKLTGHGRLTLEWALADSCNIAFAKLGEQVGVQRFRRYVKKFHLLDAADVGLPSAQGKMADLTAHKGKQELVAAAYGQGATLVTPLAAARLAATIANSGEVIEPYLIARIQRSDGTTIKEYGSSSLGQAVSQETARKVAGIMEVAVEKGIASNSAVNGYQVAAIAGSVENTEGKPNAWIVAYAPVKAPQALVTVVIENARSVQVAGSIAEEILKALLNQ